MWTHDPRVHRISALAQAIPYQRWTFAKTMPTIPHEYVLRKTWDTGGALAFDEAVETIRAYGYTKFWGNRPFIYLNINGWKYWTMGDPVPSTTVLNRARVTYDPGMYDALAADYDDWFADPNSQQEDAHVLSLLKPAGRVLDIGCGTGALLSAFPDAFTGVDYTGIDVSGPMIARAQAAHPDRAAQFNQVAFQDWWTGGYDLICALFGSASYLRPDDVARIPYLLNPDGRMFLMFYDSAYEPYTHTQALRLPGIHRSEFYKSNTGTLLFNKYRVVDQTRNS
jgi:2-polyprenyl-3-methyl-5-hydroxy-6-metoxy-1,4-benzoquinol methylase